MNGGGGEEAQQKLVIHKSHVYLPTLEFLVTSVTELCTIHKTLFNALFNEALSI
jgi:hypothetical protein